MAAAKVYLPVTPNEEAQQIAFGVYENANNYLKLSIEYKNGARRVRFAKYENGVAIQEHWTNLDDAAIRKSMNQTETKTLRFGYVLKRPATCTRLLSVSVETSWMKSVGWVTVGSCTSTDRWQRY